MRTRALSSAGVVIVGLAAAIAGGPVFALLLVCLGVAGFREFLDLANRINQSEVNSVSLVGYAVIVGFGSIALLGESTALLFALVILAVSAPLCLLIWQPLSESGFTTWSFASAGSLYLGLPVFAAVATRSMPGAEGTTWIVNVAGGVSSGWNSMPMGLSWTLTVLLVSWVGDTTAYLIGRTWGRSKLAPVISPNKTIEGSTGGLAGSMFTCAVAFQSFGLNSWWAGLIVGCVIGFAGQLGDLAESFLKRQAGVKDSGSVIPGHGGILDRIDSLLFAFPVGFLIASGFERVGT